MTETEGRVTTRGTAACGECAIRDIVLFADLTNQDISSIHLPIQDVALTPGAFLYRAGDAGTALFTVREGLLKLEQYLSDGTQRIVNILGIGHVCGLEALVADSYEHTAIALQPTKVCRIQKEIVAQLAPKLHRQLMKKWHETLHKAHDCTRDLATGSARQRVARLFLMLDHQDGRQVRLFSREDVGALLGITTATASRIIAEFRRVGVVHEITPNSFKTERTHLDLIASEG